MDTKHSLPMVIEKEMNLLDHLRQLSLMDDEKRTVYISPMVWLLNHGYIPRVGEPKPKKKGDLMLKEWLPKDLFMPSNH